MAISRRGMFRWRPPEWGSRFLRPRPVDERSSGCENREVVTRAFGGAGAP